MAGQVTVSTSIGTAGTNKVHTVTITGGPTGGTFELTAGGDATAGIAYNAAAAAVVSALEATTYVGAGDVTGSRSGAGTAGDPYVYTLTWTKTKAATDVTLTADGALLTGGSTPTATVATVTTYAARAAGTANVSKARLVSVQLEPDSVAAGDVVVSGSLDGTSWVTLTTTTVTASTNVLTTYEKAFNFLKVDSTGLTAGRCPARYSEYRER